MRMLDYKITDVSRYATLSATFIIKQALKWQ